ncbi:hypothetical protein [Vibrio parahaemolyticus]|uniref:hypothetical protein n=1 Tax=Vibrio parahaemolyticus TaxID=670 RepID=UPI0004A30336|nr:hypothetical protein [Vibrio parahaemolyticus]KON55882.1 hypothetical protein ACX02_12780 [Vibrio parahaemolyticus]KZW04925.1 hypothetical protein APF57_10430 [Vibrio parahaemolyticus]KZW09309.1 hypothetical protein APF56_05090 [Vibrio parahaemolyticus]KZW11258.1 hypothetical protein APF58_22065 [Vibrio parahaemolyticus]KZW25390.1 hypothetical protein APF60_21720 [Vibrio parahaemolyticus]
MKKILLAVLLFYTLPLGATVNTVVKYSSSEVEVCTSPTDLETCDFIKTSKLPDPREDQVKVLEITQHGMVKLNLRGNVRYIHQMDLKLKIRADVSEPCIEKNFTSTSEKNTYATHGIMEDCDEN